MHAVAQHDVDGAVVEIAGLFCIHAAGVGKCAEVTVVGTCDCRRLLVAGHADGRASVWAVIPAGGDEGVQACSEVGTSPVPPGWIARCRTPRFPVEDTLAYGCHWYQSRGGGPAWSAAIGDGGQRLILLPAQRIAIAILCGNYDNPAQRSTPLTLLRELIFPALA